MGGCVQAGAGVWGVGLLVFGDWGIGGLGDGFGGWGMVGFGGEVTPDG